MVYIPDPLKLPITSDSDQETELLAQYLFSNVNAVFYTPLEGDAIKTYRTFNDISIPLIDFPCLRVYKTNNLLYADYSAANIFQYNIDYIIAFTTRQKTSDISAYVGRDILRLLVNSTLEDAFPIQLDTSFNPRIDYDTLINPSNVVYKYTTITFRAYSMLTNTF